MVVEYPWDGNYYPENNHPPQYTPYSGSGYLLGI